MNSPIWNTLYNIDYASKNGAFINHIKFIFHRMLFSTASPFFIFIKNALYDNPTLEHRTNEHLKEFWAEFQLHF
ncbi:hypothetical protein C1645_839331 [Glomus cerebriforme]|uniref:Uncharacterized protein n=1 Tax=Glomus cerebriforme TaxID=658196 RepID=A0A397S3L4_9GLOM|nr:hypothetical protein C1645_839331 [Glomus cerebriforme]